MRVSVAIGVALLFAVNQATIAQPGSNSFRVFPISQAPAVSYFPSTNTTATPVTPLMDPQTVQLSQWLRKQIAETTRPASTQTTTMSANALRSRALADLQKRAGGDVQVRFRNQSGTPMVIKGGNLEPRFATAAKAVIDVEEATARAFLKTNRDLLRIDDPESEFALRKKERDDLGFHHLRFEQVYKKLPVWPCEVIVHINPQGHVHLMNGTYIPTPSEVAVDPLLTSQEAIQRAKAKNPITLAAKFESTEPELIIYGPLDETPKLAWKFDLIGGIGNGWRYVVDANDGNVLATISLTQQEAIVGLGIDGTGATISLNLWRDGGNYYMVDTTKAMFDVTSFPPRNGRGTIEIYDAGNREVQDTRFSAGLFSSINMNDGWDGDAVGAAFGLSMTYDYFRERFGRNSLDGLGGNIRALVRYGNNVQNAFWYGTTRTMVFGFGFTREIGIAGHELTHGIIDSVGNGGILEYRNQPGALNEALADIFGEMVEARFKKGPPDWLKSDPFEPKNREKLRQDYANPESVTQYPGRPNPSKMSQFFRLPLNEDAGGVHINSSIINHCFYLLAVGMEGALGMGDAERIFYRAMTTHLQKQSQFIDMRHACVSAAEEIFGEGSVQHLKTGEAFDRVEIFDAPTTPAPTPIPVINSPDSVLFLRYVPQLNGVVLGRREQALGDPATGTLINTGDFVLPRRISVTGDGSFAVFVTADRDVAFLRTDGTGIEFAQMTGLIHAIAVAPNGSKFAMIKRDPITAFPKNEIVIIDLQNNTEQTIKLLAPIADGPPQDIVRNADAMDFMPDGNTLIYDALSELPLTGGGFFEGWTLFALDLTTQRIATIISLNEGLDFGNPNLGNVHNHLLTHEVIDKQTGVATVFAVDLQKGAIQRIATIAQAGVVGFPAYTGDDRAIIYTQVDLSVPTTVSLFRQELAEDGITPIGEPTLWLADADYAAIYRRGTFVSSNALPQVALTSPIPGQNFSVPVNLTLTASATDPDGTVARVEFYVGSALIGSDTTPPYSASLPIDRLSSNKLLLTARAVDSLGGQSDSSKVEITFTQPGSSATPRLTVRADIIGLEISWPASASGFILQSADSLSANAVWTNVSPAPSAIGQQNIVTVPFSGTQKYYRLRR